MKKEDLVGNVYGRLSVLSEAERTTHSRASWNCRCSCGNIVKVLGFLLKSGGTKSCGCLAREMRVERLTTHGGYGTRTHRSWSHMLSRVRDPKHHQFKDYGGRGITVCERWLKFENFYADMGERPPETTLDRKDVNGNYEPGNCRWATSKEQANNKRKEY